MRGRLGPVTTDPKVEIDAEAAVDRAGRQALNGWFGATVT